MQIQPLTRVFAQNHLVELVKLAQEIPQTDYSAETILADQKEVRIFHGKWTRSLALVDGEKLIGFIMGYERAGENNLQYPQATIYLSELAIQPENRGQGLGQKLLTAFLAHNQKLGMKVFSDQPVNFSLQTNSAAFNQPVRDLYTKFGFKVRTTKLYPDRVDVVMGWTPELIQS